MQVIFLYALIALSGFAALSWEVMWQLKSSLALGVSSFGAALTLAVIMGGMSAGSYLMGRRLKDSSRYQALKLFALVELIMGAAGILLSASFNVLTSLDAVIYRMMSGGLTAVNIIGIVMILGVPSLCMGATLPVYGLLAQRFQLSITKLYSLNTLGAAFGVLFVAILLLPLFGMQRTIFIISILNLTISGFAWLLLPNENVLISQHTDEPSSGPLFISKQAMIIVFVTGFVTFVLEVAWFRSLLSVFRYTTDIFAIILACTLLALASAAKRVPNLQQKKRSLGSQIWIAGILILLVTPLIEHLDYYLTSSKQISARANMDLSGNWLLLAENFTYSYWAVMKYAMEFLVRFILIYLLIVPPLRYLGVAFPWVLGNERSASSMGKLYAVNTFAAILGSIVAAWILLPLLGFIKTAWLAGVLVVLTGVWLTSGFRRGLYALAGLAALSVAMVFTTGIGQTRVQGYFASNPSGQPGRLLEYINGPDNTIAAVEYDGGARALLINSAGAAEESGRTYDRPGAHYMAWMGHLPMLLNSNAKKALVICFGTGQTANAVRRENPQELDIVDVNANVFKLAHYFKSNENVLLDPRVKTYVMDGRAYLRRTTQLYDVITLEPMPPVTIGVNALYSREFYVLAKQRLSPKGMIAQWLPFHNEAPYFAASIAKTFIDVFPNAILWFDHDSNTGILLGSNDDAPIAASWPGFARTAIARNLSQQQVLQSVVFNTEQLNRYAAYGAVITDDNQLLSYGKALYALGFYPQNLALLQKINPAVTGS